MDGMLPACKLAAQDRAVAAEKAKAEREAARKAALAQREQALEAQAQQYVQMIRPLMWRELEFIRKTCDLEPEQRPKIKEAAEASVKKAARNIVMPREGVRHREQAAVGHAIRGDLAKVLRETLTPDQFGRYAEEAATREAALKKTTVHSVVAQIDATLFLSNDQREKIAHGLEANWQEDWEQWLQMWQYGGRYFPQVPDQHVNPYLDSEQKKVWQALHKVNVNSWGGQMEQNAADEEWWQGRDAANSNKADDGKSVPAAR
jgi:hypothetical protein